MEPVIQTSVANLTSHIENLSINSSKENNDKHLIEDVWNVIMLFLDRQEIKDLSLVSRNIRIVVLQSASYVWYVHNKPKVCRVISKFIVLLDKANVNAFRVTASFIEVLLNSGATNIAKETACSCKDQYNRSQLLAITIAQYQIQQGDIKEAKKTLTEARDLALQVSHTWKKHIALVNVIKMQVKCGDIENAATILKKLFARYCQLKSQMYIAQGQVQFGSIDSAVEIIKRVMMQIKSVENDDHEKEILKELNTCLIEMGDIPSANKTAQCLAEKYNRNELLLNFQINGLLQNNKRDEAKKILIDKKERMLRGDDRINEYHLRRIVAIQSKVDNDDAKNTLEEAKRMLLGFQINDDVVNNLIGIAEEQIRYDDSENAKDTLKSVVGMLEQVQLKLHVLNKLVRCLVELNDIETAKSVLCYMPDAYKKRELPNYNKTNALNDIAEAQLKKGDRDGAMSTLKEAKDTALLIQESYFKIKALMRITQTTFQYGDVEETKNVLEGAENSLKEAGNDEGPILDDYHKAKSLISIAELQLQMGTINIAQNTLSSAKEMILKVSEDYSLDRPNHHKVSGDYSSDRPNHHKDKVLSALFKVCLQIGDGENMMTAFKSIQSLDKKIDTLSQAIHMVEEQIESNAPTTLMSFIEDLQNEVEKAI